MLLLKRIISWAYVISRMVSLKSKYNKLQTARVSLLLVTNLQQPTASLFAPHRAPVD